MNVIEKIKNFFKNIFKPKVKEISASSNESKIDDLTVKARNKFEESIKVNLVKKVQKEIITPICEGDGTGFQTIKKY